jgi:hypothetical protein
MRRRRKGRVVAVTVGALVLAAACRAPDDSAWSGTIEERDGVLWVHNPAADPGATSPFTLELEQVFGAEEEPVEELLAFVAGIAVDDAGNVYVVDGGNDRLVAFDADGGLLWTGGRSGQGPGEFDGPNAVAWDGNDLLYVDNRGAGQIDTWRTTGEYVDSHGLSPFDIGQGWVVGLPDPDTLVLRSASRTAGDGAIVHVFDVSDDWRRSAEFFALGGRRSDGNQPARWSTTTVRVGHDAVWVGNQIRYEVREYGLDGTLRRVVAREHPPLIPPFEYRGTGFSNGGFGPPFWLNDGHGLIPRYWLAGVTDVEELKRQWDRYLASRDPDDRGRSYDAAIDLVDAEGRVLGSFPLDGAFDAIGWPELVGPDGRLYTRVYEPYPHVRRYRVELTGVSAP